MDQPFRVLLVSGSLRGGSTNTALLATARLVAPDGIEASLDASLGRLPHFNPDDDAEGMSLDPAVVELRAQIAAADAVVFCTPEYAGGLPGSFKNLLDWTVGGGETYGKPVAWINVSGPAAPTGGAGAHASLRSVLKYTGARIIEPACARIPLTRAAIGPDGSIADPAVRAEIATTLATLVRLAREPPPPND
jgi:NAD(P)H-dependent FMN reductase